MDKQHPNVMKHLRHRFRIDHNLVQANLNPSVESIPLTPFTLLRTKEREEKGKRCLWDATKRLANGQWG